MPIRGIVRGQKVAEDKLRRAKELRSRMTPEEEILWDCLRDDRFDGLHFRRQQVIDGFIIDFYCHTAGLVIEIDGGIHDDQQEADADRDATLKAKGLTVVHFRNEEINTDLIAVLERIFAFTLPPLPS